MARAPLLNTNPCAAHPIMSAHLLTPPPPLLIPPFRANDASYTLSLSDAPLHKTWFDMFNRVDTDQSGQIDFNEFCRFVRTELRVNVGALSEGRLRAVWVALDADNSGFITSGEFAAFARRAVKPPVETRREQLSRAVQQKAAEVRQQDREHKARQQEERAVQSEERRGAIKARIEEGKQRSQAAAQEVASSHREVAAAIRANAKAAEAKAEAQAKAEVAEMAAAKAAARAAAKTAAEKVQQGEIAGVRGTGQPRWSRIVEKAAAAGARRRAEKDAIFHRGVAREVAESGAVASEEEVREMSRRFNERLLEMSKAKGGGAEGGGAEGGGGTVAEEDGDERGEGNARRDEVGDEMSRQQAADGSRWGMIPLPAHHSSWYGLFKHVDADGSGLISLIELR